MLLIMNSWKRFREPEKRNNVRRIRGFSSTFCVKGGKVSQILQILITEKRLKCT